MAPDKSPKLGKRELKALAECFEMTGRGHLYRWKPASMSKLAAAGLVVVQYNRFASDSWVLTEAGRRVLADAK